MRTEFEELYKDCPECKKEEYCFIRSLRKRIRLKILNLRLKRTVSGSEQWHRMQAKLSSLSSANDDTQLRSVFYEKSCKSCKGELYVLPNVTVSFPKRLILGYNVFINKGTYITAREEISIGDNVIIGPYVVINSGMHNYKSKNELVRNQGHKKKKIKIGSDVWIGAHAVIMPGITVGEGAIIGAGAVVTHDVEPYDVVAGVPARPIGKRN